MDHSKGSKFAFARLSETASTECPCGQARRVFLDEPEQTASLHLVEISTEAKAHYHKRLTEIYYILEGVGEVELDGERIAVQPGDAVMIKPGCRHRAIGNLRILNVPIPAFDPDDEWFD
ncbi:MAG: cupin domain-containing protein [Planctomycetota bacterium]